MGVIHDRFKARDRGVAGPQMSAHTAIRVAPRAAADAERAHAALKGVYRGNCNITACQQPGAVWLNTAMNAYYCRACAKAINAPGWPLGKDTPIICFDRGVYATDCPRHEAE